MSPAKSSNLPVHLLWGEDPFLLREAAFEILGDLRTVEVDAAEWQGGETADLATPSLFGDRRALLVSNAKALPEEGVRELGRYLEAPDPDAPLTIWDNSNIVESYSGVTTPLTFSFVREIYAYVYQRFCRLMGVPPGVIAANDDTFRNMLGLVRGRIYYNLLNWYRTLALLPGYAVNRAFMEQMMGVKEPLPEPLAEAIRRDVGRGKIRDGPQKRPIWRRERCGTVPIFPNPSEC